MTIRNYRNTLFATVARLYRLALIVLTAPVIFAEYLDPQTGDEYDVGLLDKSRLIVQMMRNNARITTGSTFLEHLVIATRILKLPADTEGAIVECGCYKGGSTANLSLVAGLCDRSLHVFDSFEGMPTPSEDDRTHVLVESRERHTYAENSWRASVEEVRTNVSKYGDPTTCTLHAGYFEDSLPDFDEQCALIFLDVGLRESAETCIENLWPLLVDDGYLFTHDVKHMEISTLFFDTEWWRDHLRAEPPGLVGAGNGLGLHPGPNGFTSLLGYIVKNPEGVAFEQVEENGAGVNTSLID